MAKATNTKKNTPPTRGKGTGYRAPTKISMRESDGWSAEPQTIARVEQVAKMIAEGQSRPSIQSFIRENYGVGDRQARCYYSAAVKYMMPDDEEEYRNELIQTNLARLETIVERTLADEDYKNAISAIKEINNVIQPSKNQITIAKNDDAEIIQISFD